MPSYSVKTAAVVDSNESDNEAVDDNYVVLIEIAQVICEVTTHDWVKKEEDLVIYVVSIIRDCEKDR